MPKERRRRRFSKRKRQIKGKQELTWAYRDTHYLTEHQCYRLFAKSRWPDGVRCIYCGSDNIYERRKPIKYRCRECDRGFSLRTGTYLELLRVPLRTIVLMIFDMAANFHGVSSAQFARCAGISYTTAHRLHLLIMEAMTMDLRRNLVLHGILEADEMSVRCDRPEYPRGYVSYLINAIGVRERDGSAFIDYADHLDQGTLHNFIKSRAGDDIEAIYTDQHKGYIGINFVLRARHETVNHSEYEYVRGEVHENGMESIWASIERNRLGVHHHYWDMYAPLYWGARCWLLNHRRLGTEFTDLVKLLMGPTEDMRPEEERV